MATYYARNVTGNWAANTSWDSASSGGAGPAGPPVAGDTAVFDSGFTGTITVAAAAACAVVTCQAGAAGTLTFGAYTLTTTSDVTLVSTMTLSGSTGTLRIQGGTLTSAGISTTLGTLYISGSCTIHTSGTTWPYVLATGANQTWTLSSNLAMTLFIVALNNNATLTFAGSYDVSAGTFTLTSSSNNSIAFVAGQTFGVSTALNVGNFGAAITLKSATASSVTYWAYTGANATTVKVAGAVFTDVDFSTNSTPVTNLDNWYGGTLTRCGNTTFTVTNPTTNPTAGAVYKDSNDVNYTVDAECTATTLTTTCQTSAQPPASGTLTKVSGTGDATIDYSAYTRQGIINRTSADLPTDAAIAAAVWAYASRTLTA